MTSSPMRAFPLTVTGPKRAGSPGSAAKMRDTVIGALPAYSQHRDTRVGIAFLLEGVLGERARVLEGGLSAHLPGAKAHLFPQEPPRHDWEGLETERLDRLDADRLALRHREDDDDFVFATR